MKKPRTLGKVFCSLARTAVCVAALPFFSACDSGTKQGNAATDKVLLEADPYNGKVFRTANNESVITIISEDELEWNTGEAGIFLCKYSQSGEKLRVVHVVLGAPKVEYLRVTDKGLESDGGPVFLNPENYEALLVQLEAEREAEAKRMAEEKAALETQLAEEKAALDKQMAGEKLALEEQLAEEALRRSNIEKEKALREAEEKSRMEAYEVELQQKFAAPATKAGEVMTLTLPTSVPLKLCYCPAGTFTMGSPKSEKNRESDENQVRVTLSKGFWLAQTEFTQAQWQALMGSNPSHFEGDHLPVEQVSWEDAQDCITALNSKAPLPSGWQWALPTEAQWEYACRAGTTGAYGGALAWYRDNADGKTHNVMAKAANAWGLHDMHGNVSEWCADWYGKTLLGGTDPPSPASGSFRMFRGGSWYCDAQFCRSANRDGDTQANRRSNLGFRPAAVPAGR